MIATSTPTPSITDPNLTPTATLLLVEDEEMVAQLFVRVFRDAGFVVHRCRTGLEALLQLRTEATAIDVVLSDIRLPELSGDALAMEIRRLRPGLPVLLMTGFSETLTEENASFFGVTRVLQKPVSPRELLGAVKQAMSSVRPREDMRQETAEMSELDWLTAALCRLGIVFQLPVRSREPRESAHPS